MPSGGGEIDTQDTASQWEKHIRKNVEDLMRVHNITNVTSL